MVRLGYGRYTGVNHFAFRGRERESLGGRRERTPRVSLVPQTSHFITESAGARAATAKRAAIMGQDCENPAASRRGVLR